MSLHSPSSRRERILCYGPSGGGKSACGLFIADYLADDPEAGKEGYKVWWLDNDRSLDDMLTERTDRVVQRVDLDTEDYGSWIGKLNEIKKKIHPDDWVVLDTATEGWNAAQRYYWGRRSGNDSLAELWFKVNSGAAKMDSVGGAHGANWGVINKFYGEFFYGYLNIRAHKLFTATAKPMMETATVDTKSWYGANVSWVVDGQKQLKGDAATVLLCLDTPIGHTLTTVKEKGPPGAAVREKLVNREVENSGFVDAYLFKVAKWRP